MGGGGMGVPKFTGDPYLVTDAAGSPPAEAEVLLQTGGGVRGIRLNLADQTLGSWMGSGLDITDYDFRLDTISGSLNSIGTQAADTWITGFANMYWGVREAGSGVTTFTGTLRVRPTGGGADIDTAGVVLNAETV